MVYLMMETEAVSFAPRSAARSYNSSFAWLRAKTIVISSKSIEPVCIRTFLKVDQTLD